MKLKKLIAALCIVVALTACSSESEAPAASKNPEAQAPDNSSSSSQQPEPPASSSSPSRIDFTAYPISDPAAWYRTEGYKYAYMLSENGEVSKPYAIHVSVLPKVPDSNTIYLDGFPFDMNFGAKYAWDGSNLRQISVSNVKPVPKENLTYKPGYKYVCAVGLFGDLTPRKNEWIEGSKVEAFMKSENSLKNMSLVALDGVLLNSNGLLAYQSYWYNGNYYWVKRN